MKTILTVVFYSKAWHNWRNKRQRKKLKRLSRSSDRGFRFATKSQARSLKLCLISKNPVNMANHYKSLVRSSDHLLLIPVRLKERKVSITMNFSWILGIPLLSCSSQHFFRLQKVKGTLKWQILFLLTIIRWDYSYK